MQQIFEEEYAAVYLCGCADPASMASSGTVQLYYAWCSTAHRPLDVALKCLQWNANLLIYSLVQWFLRYLKKTWPAAFMQQPSRGIYLVVVGLFNIFPELNQNKRAGNPESTHWSNRWVDHLKKQTNQNYGFFIFSHKCVCFAFLNTC